MTNRRIIKYFFIITCFIAILYPLVNIYYIFPSFSELLVNSTEEEAVRVAKNLSLIVISDNNGLRGKNDFADEIEKSRDEFNIARIKVFSKKGEIVYSTDKKKYR